MLIYNNFLPCFMQLKSLQKHSINLKNLIKSSKRAPQHSTIQDSIDKSQFIAQSKPASSISYQSHVPIYHNHVYRKNSYPNRSLIICSKGKPKLNDNDNIPSRARELTDMVNKKHHLLIIKHRIQDFPQKIPDMLEIKQSVKESQIVFIRKMSKRLLKSGQSYLLKTLKSDIRSKSYNYMQEVHKKYCRNSRSFLRKPYKNNEEECLLSISSKQPPKSRYEKQ